VSASIPSARETAMSIDVSGVIGAVTRQLSIRDKDGSPLVPAGIG